ncbi:MAG: hypothetical protein ACRDLV_11805 [Solirubrobacteraceae bacterium]
MRRRLRTTRRLWLPAAVLALLAVLGLLVAGSQAMAVRTFSIGEPNGGTVATLHVKDTVCEGPVVSHGPARAVAIWGSATTGLAELTVSVRDAANARPLASGTVITDPAPGGYTAHLMRPVPGGRPVTVCVRGDIGGFLLSGGSAVAPGVRMTGAPGSQFSLVMFSAGDRTLLGSLGTAFSRASLWRPSWVGSWTFWVLTIALLGTFVLAVAAVAGAAADDQRDEDPEDRDGPGAGGGPRRSDDDGGEALRATAPPSHAA